MPILTPSAPSIIPPTKSALGAPVKDAANRARYDTAKSQDAQIWGTAGEALSSIQRQLDQIYGILQQPVPQSNPVQIVNTAGALVAEIGDFVDPTNNQGYEGVWANNLWIGGSGPATAPFFSNGSVVAIGNGGQLQILDPYGNVAAWLGSQVEASQNVTGAVGSGGLIELTVTAHGYRTGDWV